MDTCEVYAKLATEALSAGSSLSWCLMGLTHPYTQDLGLQYIEQNVYTYLANIKALLKDVNVDDFKNTEYCHELMSALDGILKDCVDTINAKTPEELFPGLNLDELNAKMYQIIGEIKEIKKGLTTI